MKLRHVIGTIIREWNRLLAAMTGLAFFSMVLPLTVPLLERFVINSLQVGTSLSPWVWAAIVFLFPWRSMRLVSLAMRWTLQARYQVSVTTGLRHALLAELFRSGRFGGLPPGEALNRLRDDVGTIVRFLIQFLILVLRFLAVIGAVFILARIHAELTFVVFVPFVAMVIQLQALSPLILRRYERARATTGGVAAFLGDLLGAIDSIQIAGAQPSVLGKFRKINRERRDAAVRNTLLVTAIGSSLGGVHQASVALIILLSIDDIAEGRLMFGDFFVFFGYFHWISAFSADFGRILIRLKQVRVSWNRLRAMRCRPDAPLLIPHADLAQTPPAVSDEPSPSQGPLTLVEARGLTAIHPKSGRGVRDVSLKLEAGSFTVVCGRTGSGKTTFLKALIGLIEAQKGSVLVNGRANREPGGFFRPPLCSYTPQAPRLLSVSIRDNILLGHQSPPGKVEEIVGIVGLRRDLAEMEEKLETIVGPRGAKLSGGQLQRTAAARMIASESQLWVFDDISSALDAETESVLWENICRLGKTCLLVSNKRVALRRADRIILLQDGRVEAQGTWRELLASKREFSRIWQSQAAAGPSGTEG